MKVVMVSGRCWGEADNCSSAKKKFRCDRRSSKLRLLELVKLVVNGSRMVQSPTEAAASPLQLQQAVKAV